MNSLFLMTTMMQANCDSTNVQMNTLLPLLLLDDETDDSNLKTMLLFQTMSQVIFYKYLLLHAKAHNSFAQAETNLESRLLHFLVLSRTLAKYV